MKLNSTDILEFFFGFLFIKKALIPKFTYLGLWSIFGRKDKQINENLILETLEQAKSAKNDQFMHMQEAALDEYFRKLDVGTDYYL